MHEVLEGSDRYKIDYIHDGSIASSPEAVSSTQIADPAATSEWRPATAARPSILTSAVVDWQTLHTSPTGVTCRSVHLDAVGSAYFGMLTQTPNHAPPLATGPPQRAALRPTLINLRKKEANQARDTNHGGD